MYCTAFPTHWRLFPLFPLFSLFFLASHLKYWTCISGSLVVISDSSVTFVILPILSSKILERVSGPQEVISLISLISLRFLISLISLISIISVILLCLSSKILECVSISLEVFPSFPSFPSFPYFLDCHLKCSSVFLPHWWLFPLLPLFPLLFLVCHLNCWSVFLAHWRLFMSAISVIFPSWSPEVLDWVSCSLEVLSVISVFSVIFLSVI